MSDFEVKADETDDSVLELEVELLESEGGTFVAEEVELESIIATAGHEMDSVVSIISALNELPDRGEEREREAGGEAVGSRTKEKIS